MIFYFSFLIEDVDGYFLLNEENMPGYLLDVFPDNVSLSKADQLKWLGLNNQFTFEDDNLDEITVYSLHKKIMEHLNIPIEWIEMNSLSLYFQIDEEVFCVIDRNKKLSDILSFYSNPDCIRVFWVFSAYQGEVFRDRDVRYYMYSNENKHNGPHVHVNVGHGKYSASINILTGEVFDGELPKGNAGRRIKDTIEKKKEKFVDYWNKHTNGIDVDINYLLGSVSLEIE